MEPNYFYTEMLFAYFTLTLLWMYKMKFSRNYRIWVDIIALTAYEMYAFIILCFLEFSKVDLGYKHMCFLRLTYLFEVFLCTKLSSVIPDILSVTSILYNELLFWNPKVFFASMQKHNKKYISVVLFYSDISEFSLFKILIW